MRLFIAVILTFGSFLMASPLVAETVRVENNRGEKVKFCTYRSDDQSLIRPRRCWMLNRGQSMKWDRDGEKHAIDVRLFEPGAFELPICLKQNISNSYRIEITPQSAKSCVVGHERTYVPPQNWPNGARVWVNSLDDNYWYPATVVSRQGEQYRVRYYDRRVSTLDGRLIADLTLDSVIPLQVNWKRQGRWYPVRLKSAKDDRVRVIFEDGAEEDASLDLVRITLSER